MPSDVRQGKQDHLDRDLPEDITASVRNGDDCIVAYRVRWREEDENGIERRPSKSFSARKHGSLDNALQEARSYKSEIGEILEFEKSIARPDPWTRQTLNDVLREWVAYHGPEVQREYAEKLIKRWAKYIEHRPIARMPLERVSEDPGSFVRFQDELVGAKFKPWLRYEILKDVRAVTRWGRERHPAAITVEVGGIIKLPKIKRTRLAFAADAITVERLVEAVLKRPARDDLLPLRDAALIAAMGFTMATRPSEWRLSAQWDGLVPPAIPGGLGSILMQKAVNDDAGEDEAVHGLKTGAHVALVAANAYNRITIYREALEDRFGPQPGHGLIFQVIDAELGPLWIEDKGGGPAIPLGWTKVTYNHWYQRVFVPARDAAAEAPDTPPGVADMTFYDLRHTAISMALHSTLVMTSHGMNMNALAAYSAHDIITLERYYRHIIARYLGSEPIVLEDEAAEARRHVEAEPFTTTTWIGPQKEAQKRRREREAEKAADVMPVLAAA